MLDAALLIVVCLAYLLLGGFVLANNPKANLNRALAYLCFTLVAWSTVSFLEDTGLGPTATKILVTADFSFAVFVVWLFYLFCYELYGRKLKLPSFLIAGLSILSIGFTLAGRTVGIRMVGKHVHFVPKTGYWIVLLLVAITLIGGLTLLVIRRRHTAGRSRAQIQFIFSGLFLTAFFIVLTNVVLPDYRQVSPSVTRLGIYSTLFFIGASAYTIFKHRFLDIRLLVARTVAYTMLVISLAAIFAAAIFGLSAIFFKDNAVDNGVKIAYASLAVVMAFIFQPLKRFFDRVSNRIFYRDAYDSQEVIDNLNGTLASTIDIEDVLGKSSAIIADELKLAFCTFAVRIPPDETYQLIGVKNHHLTPEKVEALKAAAHSIPKKIIITDELETSAPHLKDLLRGERLGAIVRLREISVSRTHSSVYLLLGEKNSGSIYSDQDVRILDILADELVIAIQNSLRFEEIKRFNITLQEKVEEATRQLRRANHRLRELDATKDEFISMASHQLRTPLTTIKGYLSMVLEGDVGPLNKNEKQMVRQAFDSAERMVFLIADLLNVSRLQSGKFVIENKPTDLAKMIETEVAQLQETAVNHHLTLTYKKPPDFPMVNIDEMKIRQVAMNFMDNAIYYTPAGGSIEAELTTTDEEIRFTVTDTGLGVPRAEQHHLFTKFYRAGNARKMRPDGTGLGLFMAKKVITAQGGAIIFRSAEGKGSTFGFSFPRSMVEVKRAPKPITSAKSAPKPEVAAKT